MTDQPPIRPRRGLESLRPYQPRPDEPGISLRLDNNEAPSAVAELAAKALRETTAEEIRRYPVPAPLEAQIAERYTVEPSRVIVTAGADDALARIMTAFLDRDRKLLSVVPTFEMIPVDARVAGADIVEVQWGTGDFPIGAILEQIKPGISVITVVTPNNPTGLVAPVEQLKQIASQARRIGAVLVVDVAYAEFAETDPTRDLLDIENVIVVRTLSKAWGLAGLRVGYAIAPAPLADCVRVAGGPYPTSGPSLRAASVMLDSGEPVVQRVAEEVIRERDVLCRLLRACGFEVTESKANFVFARAAAGPELARALKDAGILIRSFSKPGLKDAVRITCPGDPAGFDRLCRAILRWARPRAILFDLDGVIADVSGSYRRAIADTCAHFGVRITSEQIETVKLEGNANNDWVVTHRLLTRAGVEVEYDTVTDEFERRYHGTPGQPGLNETETMLLAIEQLRAVTSAFPCAIVTGRPREDAAEFLDRFELRDSFDAIVCMEDAEQPKPSPKPLEEALKRLREAGRLDNTAAGPIWMIGDTVDDLRAAIAQGAIPLGVRAPGAPATSDDGLRAAGAALVRPHILELFDAVLPNWKEAADGALR